MITFFYRKFLVGKKIREYERQALAHEFEASEIYLDIRNSKGLITAEQEDITANDADIKQDEFDIEKLKKASDDELFQMHIEAELTNGKSPSDLPKELTAELLAELRKEANETIQAMQQEIKNLKAANERARSSIIQLEGELKGLTDGTGKVIKQGHNTRYQGHVAASQKARIHATELKKFLKKSHKNKIKLAEDKTYAATTS